jgi:hypothetical protein
MVTAVTPTFTRSGHGGLHSLRKSDECLLLSLGASSSGTRSIMLICHVHVCLVPVLTSCATRG